MPYHILGYTTGTGSALPDNWVGRSSTSLLQQNSDPDGPWSLAFNPDGTKVVTWEEINNPYGKIVEYNLGTAWDITTLSAPVNTKVRGSAGWFRDNVLEFNGDGSALYLINGTNLYRYDISGYSIAAMGSNASFTGNNFFGYYVQTMRFSQDGSKVFTAGEGEKFIRQYNLSTPYDIEGLGSSPAHDGEFTTVGLPTFINGNVIGNVNIEYFQIDPSGNTLITSRVDGVSRTLYRMALTTPFDITTVDTSTLQEVGQPGGNGNLRTWRISPDGQYYYEPSYGNIEQHTWT